MNLSPMRYKDYIWPHNPTTYSIAYERQVAVHKVPFGRYCTQDLGLTCRVMRGEGVFAGEGAYEEFKALATVFYGGGPGLLIHPVWQVSSAYFTALRWEQGPPPDAVRYGFGCGGDRDDYSQPRGALAGGGRAAGPDRAGSPAVHTVTEGENLWAIAQNGGVTLEALLAANPAIKNPNLIHPGDQVVIPC